jgi:RNA polymerase sigma-70 factor (ECF subfamily)
VAGPKNVAEGAPVHSETKAWVEELAHEHGRMVFGAAYRVLGKADDAEDVLQAVFVKLLDGRIGRTAAADWGAFLRVTATHQALDVLRSRGRHAWEPLDVVENVAPSSNGSSPAAALDASRAAERLRQAMAALPSRDARIFALRFFEELSYEQIAVQESASVSQVGVVIHRTRKRLRDILDQQGATVAPGKS